MQLNAIDLDKMLKSEKREVFSGILTPENVAKWKDSVHAEKQTEEFTQIMDALRQRQRELEEQRQLKHQREKESQHQAKEGSKPAMKEIQLTAQAVSQTKEKKKQAIISQEMLEAPVPIQSTSAKDLKASLKKEKKIKKQKAEKEAKEKAELKKKREKEKEE